MSETIGPSEEERGISQPEAVTEESKQVEPWANFHEMAGEIHGKLGDEGIKLLGFLELNGDTASREKARYLNASPELVNSLKELMEEHGGHPQLRRLDWLSNPSSDFPG
ncbi:MAG: hypothetical protein Q8Q05_01910 [bacterium]|nr:hypothetical protein [bacterium]